ncbi:MULTISPECIES: 2-oxoglutarate dehydrogenase complex dihydrolipoyllysine-residue succinyltransferase [Candidatus Ichthyocystis]|uniref:2-oxoglutarate dehydrogenase complex dihydrolipoyllysine-residue succinyltransferase n=1 Tax=Candidatus Ichthyocystis TaxID=2929841 RepID=UPI000A601779|nr:MULTISPECIES: 2-oxoglutarate dehydrogenase complex dihydrolipoyllysine-residue succinyltransferase [Ichthyocystis]
MSVKVKVPQLSESVSEATLLSWQKHPGDVVKRGEVLVEIETDKIVMEIPSPVDGVLSSVVELEGAVVVSGQDVACIDEVDSTDELSSPPPPAADHTRDGSKKSDTEKLLMPAAVSTAAKIGLTVDDSILGSGLGGRVLKEDVLRAYVSSDMPTSSTHEVSLPTVQPERRFSEGSSSVSTRSVDTSSVATSRREPMSRLRSRIAERLLESQASTATLTTFNEVNMRSVMDLRKRYVDDFEKEYGVRLGFMSFFVKAVVASLRKFPVLNASIDGNDIVYHNFFNIGVAVGTERGLVVPVLRDVDRLSMSEIEIAIGDYAKRAQSGHLTLDELSGGTFSISNGGAYGSMMSTPIINPPQSAILGIHGIKERPIVESGEIVVRPMVYLALSYDHRIIDGREAVLGLVAIKDALEDPSRLLLGV